MSQNDDLERRLRDIDQEIGHQRAQIEADSPTARKERSIILGISAGAGIVGLIFAGPTSGLSLVLAVPGVWLTARETAKDNEITNRARHAVEQISQLEKEYAEIRAELEKKRRR